MSVLCSTGQQSADQSGSPHAAVHVDQQLPHRRHTLSTQSGKRSLCILTLPCAVYVLIYSKLPSFKCP